MNTPALPDHFRGYSLVIFDCDSTLTTLEGIDEAERQAFADAFAACGGLQCGFCIPGIVMRAKSQIDKKGADLTREKIKDSPEYDPSAPVNREFEERIYDYVGRPRD